MSQTLNICIGDVSISIHGDAVKSDREIMPAYRPFIGCGKRDIHLRLHQGLRDCPVGEEKVFECPPIWSLYRQNKTSVVRIFHTLSGLERILVLPPHLERTDLYFAGEPCLFPDPFYGPTMELMMIQYLARGRGAVIHSCSICKNGKGFLFVGESGAGKSTMAGMWNKVKGVDILSDDRTIVRKKGGQFWMYGTPWHGEAKFGSARKVRLERIFFLHHGQGNQIKEIKGIDPVLKLLTCSFLPYWEPEGTAFALDFFTDLTTEVQCQELFFKPDESIFSFMEGIVT